MIQMVYFSRPLFEIICSSHAKKECKKGKTIDSQETAKQLKGSIEK